MAYNLQAFKRAEAIIGEGNDATAGTANFVEKWSSICEEEFGKEWWNLLMPNRKAVHAVTGTNWGGVGVKSDIVAGQGEWIGVTDAKEIANKLARRLFEPEKEL